VFSSLVPTVGDNCALLHGVSSHELVQYWQCTMIYIVLTETLYSGLQKCQALDSALSVRASFGPPSSLLQWALS
jgi:hypothetical protein